MNEEERHRTFDEWLARHRGLLFKVVNAYAFSPPDKEDLFQEVATQVWRSIPTFKGDSKVSTWLYRVAIFSAITWSRRESRHRVGREALDGVEDVPQGPGLHPGDRASWLYDQIRRLDPIERSLMLLLLEGFTYEEMAGVLGISEGNVGVKVHRIKKRLASRARKEENYGV
jgi:RNA polymerase sigma-70 factor (ECF subfamily)